MNPKLVLLMGTILVWLLAWLERFIPPLNKRSALFRGTMAFIMAVTSGGIFVAEAWLYRSLAGRRYTLRDDNFFLVSMIVEGLVGFAIILKSESVLRQREKETRLGK